MASTGDDHASLELEQDFVHRVAILKRKLESSAREITSIVNQGRQATKDPAHKPRFLGMYKCIEKYFSKYESVYEELIEAHLEIGSSAFPTKDDLTAFENYRRYYYETHTICEGLTAQTVQVISPGSKAKAPLETTIKLDTSSLSTSSNLPSIKIPPFDGEYTKWPRFRDYFKSVVHDTNISDMSKFHYLVSSLGPKASIVINHLALVEDNYIVAWEALLREFDNKRVLAATYLNTILDSTPLAGNPSKESLTEFLSKVTENVSAFQLLNIPNEANFILYYLTFRCLDKRSREQFELQFKNTPFPTFENLTTFIRDHCKALQLADFQSLKVDTPANASPPNKKYNYNLRSSSKPNGKGCLMATNDKYKPYRNSNVKSDETNIKPCFVCSKPHKIIDCPNFTAADASQRRNLLKGFYGCYNCLGPHSTKTCQSIRSCRFCSSRHHSMLHLHNNSSYNSSGNMHSAPRAQSDNRQIQRQLSLGTTSSAVSTTGAVPSSSKAPPENASCYVSCQSHGVMLATAVVHILNYQNIGVSSRVVVDSGSQISMMTSRLANKLALPIFKCKQKLSGIGGTPFTLIKGKTKCTVTPSNRSSPAITTEILVADQVTPNQPNFSLPSQWIEPYLSYELADPTFWESREIDAVLGAEVFAQIFLGERVQLHPMGPILYSSSFGYLLIGAVPHDAPLDFNTSLFISKEPSAQLTDDLRKFWELEESFDDSNSLSNSDSLVEDFFLQTFSRNEEGRYIIRLPFLSSVPEFDNSSSVAMKRFLNMESKLKRDHALCTQYVSFMKEYEELGHMSISTSPSKFILPHHSVMKEGKIRVVFDASSSTSQGSLNHFLHVGPKLQKDIKIILSNFRRHKVVFVTDIVKMYRQILIHPSDTPYQHIFWRSNPMEAIQKFELKTLTYGMSSAPYLALRVVKQLCIDEGHKFPKAAKALEEDIYIDDLATGAASLPAAIELQQQTINLLEKAGFKLSKWSSNYKELIPDGSGDTQPRSLNIDDDFKIKILGLQWDPKLDAFGYRIVRPDVPETKRGLLSAIARIYDPLGWLAPTVVLAKCLIQELWKDKLGWDDPILSEIQSQWQSFVDELPNLSKISIPRYIIPDGSKTAQIVGFCDASMKAYSATLYLKIVEPNPQLFLLTGRSRLAPLKTVSIPRLELCGAVLLSQTYESMKQFIKNISIPLIDPLFFTDSQIVLSWLRTEPYNLKTFVANRVSQITSVIPIDRWCHVTSRDNPSDISSRGLLPNHLISCKLWWNGPDWLTGDTSHWPISLDLCPKSEIPELKPDKRSTLHVVVQSSPFIVWMERCSSYKKIIRTLGWVHRFISQISIKKDQHTGFLSLKEINMGLNTCIKVVQSHYFFEGKEPNERKLPSKFSNLCPYLDHHDILRVGGRLSRSNLPEHSKHPILLPGDCHFTKLLVDHYHAVYLHPGPALLQALIQRKYWIPSLRRISRQRTFLCVRCYRSKANKTVTPLMSDLPESRVQPARPFLRTGVDFAGPFQLRHSLLRKPVISKMYLCVFVCMSTKAVHLEAVTDLTTVAFLACLSRFAARRGFPQHMFSDCGTNFVGAANHFTDLRKWLKSSKTQKQLGEYASDNGFTWNFNVPYGPHHGGIWEAVVKSSKTIIRKVAGDTALTLEEWFTLFTKIESILNSRPLCPLSTSPEETNYLSPGHFLIGDHLTTPPEPSLQDKPINRLTRWQLVKKISEDFWKRWSLEYLTTLQTRSKWTKPISNVKVGELMLLRDENSQPLHWPLGRITKVLPGKDGVVRVVQLKVGTSEHLRPVHKLIPLRPLNEEPFTN